MTALAQNIKSPEFPRVAGLNELRGEHGEIVRWFDATGRTVVTAAEVLALFRDCLPDTYCQFDRRGRGDAVNVDLYGYDPLERIAVVQARHAFRRAAGHLFLNVRKTYFLCGHNELTGLPFRHPVDAAAVHGALRHRDVRGSRIPGVELVRRVQGWMWQVTPNQLARAIRQGDVLVVPEPRLDRTAYRVTGLSGPASLLLADSHRVTADEVVEQNGRVYAWNPRLDHVKDQHAPVQVVGWCSLRVARDCPAWNFAVRLGD